MLLNRGAIMQESIISERAAFIWHGSTHWLAALSLLPTSEQIKLAGRFKRDAAAVHRPIDRKALLAMADLCLSFADAGKH